MTVLILALTAFGLGFLHTILEVDHYIPFAAISKTHNWSRKRTLWVVIGCGFGHTLGTIILCGICAFAATALAGYMDNIANIGGIIGNAALVLFGLIYVIWGIYAAVKNKPHVHKLPNGQTIEHYGHDHFPRTEEDSEVKSIDVKDSHVQDDDHKHETAKKPSNKPIITLFILFIFTPCEVLIPLLLKPPASTSVGVFFIVSGSFAISHLITMISATWITMKGISLLPLKKVERYMYIITGGLILLCAALIISLGL